MCLGTRNIFFGIAIAILGLVACGGGSDDAKPSTGGGGVKASGGSPGTGGKGAGGASTGGASTGGASTGGASSGGSTNGGTGPLANLPSPAGPHIDKIIALGDNEWLSLGAPAPDPKWGKARGRSWGAKMGFAPDLRGGFLYGEGPHAYVKPTGPDAGYVMDDLWFYDLNGNRWICIYPGTNTKTFNQQVQGGELKVNSDGMLVDADGQPLPNHALIHAWGNLTYDPDQKKFAFEARWNGGSYFAVPEIVDGLDMLKAQGMNGKPVSPWFYDTTIGKFERYVVPALSVGGDASDDAATQFIYVGGKYFSGGRNGVSFFDPATRVWTNLAATGPMPKGTDNSATYDPKRDRIYLGGGDDSTVTAPGDNFFIYDIKTATWSKPNPTGDFPMHYNSNHTFFNYDSVNDVVLLMSEWGQQIYAYDPETNSWAPPLAPPPDVYIDSANSGFYDPTLNAFILHYAHDGEDNGNVWAYRYKKAT